MEQTSAMTSISGEFLTETWKSKQMKYIVISLSKSGKVGSQNSGQIFC